MFDFDGKEHLRSRKARRRKTEDLRGLVLMYLPRIGLCLPDPLRLRHSLETLIFALSGPLSVRR